MNLRESKAYPPTLNTSPAKSHLRSPPRAELLLSNADLISLSRAVLAKGVPFRFQARGLSMSPFIRDGDVLTVTPLGEAAIGLGEVVAYIQPQSQRFMVHRVTGHRKQMVVIQGDNNPAHQDRVPIPNILGRIIRVERSGREVRLGLGLERVLLAWMVRTRLLGPVRRLRRWINPRMRHEPPPN